VTGPKGLARNTPVADCVGLLAIEPLLVAPTTDVVEVLHRAAAQPQTRIVGVVDELGRLVGTLPILRLAEAVIARVTPEALMAGLGGLDDVAWFGHAVETREARDAMLPPASIAPTATVGDAFRIMHQRRISGLYVVDADGRPTGYLDLLELAEVYVRALVEADEGTGPAAAPAD
jgi:CBS domain-containing protein